MDEAYLDLTDYLKLNVDNFDNPMGLVEKIREEIKR